MSLVRQGGRMSSGTLGGLGVVRSRSLGGSGPPLRVLGPFTFAAPSLTCPPSELHPHVHPGDGSCCCCGRPAGEGGYRTSCSFPRLLQPSFWTPKVTGEWRLVIDLSRLNGWVDVSHFHMETAQSVLQSLRPGDWMPTSRFLSTHLLVGT